jgi:hypothetical protein
MSYLNQVCENLGLEILRTFDQGHVSKGVALVRSLYGNANSLSVIKTADGARTLRELRENYIGYHHLQQMGVGDFVPPIIDVYLSEIRNLGYIWMEFAGDNFYDTVFASDNPFENYQLLIREVQKIYGRTLQHDQYNQVTAQMQFISNKIAHVERKYLQVFHDENMTHLLCQAELFVETVIRSSRLICFSHWTFTPEDVYVRNDRILCSDLGKLILGLPIIDLACFAGVARDEYRLPYAESGYELIFNFATHGLAEMLGIKSEISIKIFYLARVLQSFLSARFAMAEPDCAEWHFNTGMNFLKEISA